MYSVHIKDQRKHFSASHFLRFCGDCEQLHGHNYTVDVFITGPLNEDGMVMDFNQLKAIIKKEVIDELDHNNLNDIIDNPTAEKILEWIENRLREKLNLYSIRLYEGNGKWVQKQYA